MRRKKSLAVRISGAILLCLLLLLPACAAAGINDKNTLNVSLSYKGKALASADLELYRLADLADDGQILWNPEEHNGIDLQQWDADGVTDDIEAYIKEKEIQENPDGEYIESKGLYTWKNLQRGVYFFTGTQGYIGDDYFTLSPGVVKLPYVDFEDEQPREWKNELTVSNKLEPKPTTIKVRKRWDDGDYASRPKQITVCLLRDEKCIDEHVTLSKANGWTHTWTDREQQYTWTVAEETNLASLGYKKPDYKKVQQSDGTVCFEIVNYRPTPKDPTLPQTGLDWWPVAILAIAGMTMFFLGWLRRRQEENDDEDAEA